MVVGTLWVRVDETQAEHVLSVRGSSGLSQGSDRVEWEQGRGVSCSEPTV